VAKRAFLFPGQGSQYVGMAKDIYENSSNAKELVQQAEDAIDFNISRIMFEGPVEELKLTSITQPAIYLHSLLLLNELEENNIYAVAGHSLGEYSALVANKSLDSVDALKLVRKRGEAMLEAGRTFPGTMAAVIGMDSSDLENICEEASKVGVVQCANFNSPGQIVISGSIPGVKKAMELCKEQGVRLVKELVVSGAFHSPLMKPAVNIFQDALFTTEFYNPDIPVYSNVTAEPTTDSGVIKELLVEQLTKTVRWEETINNMIRDGITDFIEVGPGKVLQGLVKRINPDVNIQGLEKFKDLNKFS